MNFTREKTDNLKVCSHRGGGGDSFLKLLFFVFAVLVVVTRLSQKF